MIYQYIKANHKVAEHLGIATQRLQFPDGNYLLWKFDLMPLGGNNDDTLRMIGGVGMNSEQVRDEQRGVTTTKLPTATDERFKIDSQSEENNDLANGDQPESTDQPNEPEHETENESTGEGSGESNDEAGDQQEQEQEPEESEQPEEPEEPEESDGTGEGE